MWGKSVILIAMINPQKYGVSFSLKQCRNFGLDPKETLAWLIKKGWRRFRLMSYWNEHEKVQGSYDFSELDWQMKMIENAGGEVTLCLGVKQPRWPEYHWPTWAYLLAEPQKTHALLAYLTAVVEWYKDVPFVTSYQLENEALLRGFGTQIDISRKRLRAEYTLLSRIDSERPIFMSTSNGWGIPLRRPHPRGGVGFSIYTMMYERGRYRPTIQKPWLHRLRRFLIEKIIRKNVFIHELQVEPWGSKNIWEMSTEEQAISMSPERIRFNIDFAQRVGALPVDLWGAEWWYWRSKNGDPSTYKAVEDALRLETD